MRNAHVSTTSTPVRRGLGTNLHDLGVDDKTIQAILRHGNVAITQQCYIKTLPQQQTAAMGKFEARIDALCNQSSGIKDDQLVFSMG